MFSDGHLERLYYFSNKPVENPAESVAGLDRGIVPDVSSKSLPVYFHRGFQDLKDQMIGGETNPLTNNAFIVDVYVHRADDGDPKAHYVTNVHRVVPLGAAT